MRDMAIQAEPTAMNSSDAPKIAALQHFLLRSSESLIRALTVVERFLGKAGFDRAPWLVIAFAAGIGAWFALASNGHWWGLLAACLGIAAMAAFLMRVDGRFPLLRAAVSAVAVMIAAGCGTVWMKSSLAGAAPITRPVVAVLEATVLERQDLPAEQKVRLIVLTKEPGSARSIRARINLPDKFDSRNVSEGAVLRLRARLLPPAPPLVPGAYNFARTAWFAGIAATGSALGKPEVLRPGKPAGQIAFLRRSLSEHIRKSLPGSAGAIAMAFASGDRGSIAEIDDSAMRDAGLTHLLSVSGLHVSAVIAAVYFLATRLLGLWPWLVLRVRLPLLGSGLGALAGIAYTIFTGAEVPTIRSCIGAVLVLIAIALGREPLSMRMLAVVGFIVLLFWPEALVSPGFQMSFASVMAIVALHQSGPARAYLAPQDESMLSRGGRRLLMLLITGIAIELSLMPIGLFHFHRAGVYGALANVIAIPLTTLLSMPLIALALLADFVGMGAPFWWLAGKSLDLLLGLAHWTASQPGAKAMVPAMSAWQILLFVAGWLWLVLWQDTGRVRLLGLPLIAISAFSLVTLRAPDVLVSKDGRYVGVIPQEGTPMLMLRGEAGSYAYDTLMESAGQGDGDSLGKQGLASYPGAHCNHDFCLVTLSREGRDWELLISRGRDPVPMRALAAACDRADIVISERFLPQSCQPRWLKLDRAALGQSGGVAINLTAKQMRSVADGQVGHGWWRPEERRPFRAVTTPPR